MSVENFFTTQAQILPVRGQNTARNASPDSSVQGLNFVDYILARINELNENPEAEKDSGVLQSDNPLLDKNPELNLAELLAANPEIEQEIKDFAEATGLGADAELIQTLSLNQQAFDDVLKPLTDGVITTEEIANGSPRILQAFLIEDEQVDAQLLTQIQEIKTKIQNAVDAQNGEILATNLTPEQITSLQDLDVDATDIQAALERLGIPAELAEKTAVAFIELSENPAADITDITEISDDPALQNLLAILLPPAAKSAPKNSADLTVEPLASRLNSLNVGGSDDAPVLDIEEYEGSLTNIQKGSGKGASDDAFDALMKAAGKASPAPSVAPDLSLLQNFPFAAEGSLMSSLDLPFGSFESAQASFGNALTPAALTSVAAQAPAASAAHPATQMISITMQKAASGGENKTLMMELDPPELGRVEVRMTFGKEKTLKAILTAEKPETFLMMQRDSQALERALQEMGLDTGDGLSFELAEQGFDFQQDNNRGGGHDEGGTGAGSENSEEELIETTMTWHVDPESGHMRYNILA